MSIDKDVFRTPGKSVVIVKRGTRKWDELVGEYKFWLHTPTKHLQDYYRNPSERKKEIFRSLQKKVERLGGQSLSVLSHNSNFFTAGWLVEIDEIAYFVKETYARTYVIRITWDMAYIQPW